MTSLTASSSLTGRIFGQWQPDYAERGLATFPVRIEGANKIPMTKGYLRTGIGGSTELAKKFPDAVAMGVVLNSHLMIVDVDDPRESALADALSKYGNTPLIARTASKGGYHCYFGENAGAWQNYKGKRRAIKPDPDRPVDFLGTGFAVLPPSRTAKGRYEFIQGNLDDLNRLPPFQTIIPPKQGKEKEPDREVREGKRNNTLFDECRRRAKHCSSLDMLLGFARMRNSAYLPPMDDVEVIKTAKSAWKYEVEGRNYISQKAPFSLQSEFAFFLECGQLEAFALLAFLLDKNGPQARFWIANGMADAFNWSRKCLSDARQFLLDAGYIIQVSKPFKGRNAEFVWGLVREREGRGCIG
jgi:Bifunctional DNA primase/polymerase, N-terminal/Primase C terminal 1 (PriCT-1)